jgi:hypothetical protein
MTDTEQTPITNEEAISKLRAEGESWKLKAEESDKQNLTLKEQVERLTRTCDDMKTLLNSERIKVREEKVRSETLHDVIEKMLSELKG